MPPSNRSLLRESVDERLAYAVLVDNYLDLSARVAAIATTDADKSAY
ncbi:MAG: hypothetical protein ACJ72M_08830 [Propionibacteriaceae bacterium]|jgi:hypothetical protein